MDSNTENLIKGSIVRNNLLTVPGYLPYCGNPYCSNDDGCRTKWDVNQQQFVCKCGWISKFPKDFVVAYTRYRVDSQVCEKCGVICGENKQKYCGDGSDKDNSHMWKPPVYN